MRELTLQNTRLDGRYDVLRLLGRGSYAEIYLARDNFAAPDSPHQLVVIKALNVFLQDDPDADLEKTLIENFQNEAVALDRVRHPNVINRLGHGTARDLQGTIFHYIVLEYLAGGNFAELCRRAPLSFEKALFYLEQVCAGLDHAHKHSVIHRDIKPQNLLLTTDREIVKIADFGVARFANLDSPITRVGTNIYAAPEHSPLLATGNPVNGNSHPRLTPAADVYSLAKTAYAIISCDSPRRFQNSPITELPAHLNKMTWAHGLLRVLKKATQNDAGARHQSVIEFWEDLLRVKKEIESDDLTEIRQRELQTASLGGFVPKALPSPSFPSMRNIQTISPESVKLPERPNIVVELNKTGQANAFSPNETQFKTTSGNQIQINDFGPVKHKKNETVYPELKKNEEQPETKAQISEKKRPRTQGFFKRLLVSLVLLAMFTTVLFGTYNYFQSTGWLPGYPGIFHKQKGTANKDAWLRSSPAMGNNQIGLVTKESELRVLNSEGNWYEVEIIRQGQPEKATSNSQRGWVGKSIVDIQ